MPQRLAQHLIARGLLPASVIDEALRRTQTLGGTLDTALLELGRVSEVGVLQAIADVAGVRLVNLADFEPNTEAGPLVPWKMARQLNVVPLSLDADTLHLASCYPLQQAALRELGFLLGRKLELWCALECRVRDWQSTLYGEPLDARFKALLRALDPTRAPVTTPPVEHASTETLSSDVLERIARGIVDEPLLLDKKKKRKPKIEPVDAPPALGDELAEPHTAVLEPAAYSRFASGKHAELGVGHEEVPTRVLDADGYASFARQLSNAGEEAPAVRVSFPGGVLPPRRGDARTPPPPRPATPLVTPASAPRPVRPRAPASSASEPTTLPPDPTTLPAKPIVPKPPPRRPADETDFSDVNEAFVPKPAPATRPSAPPPKRTPARSTKETLKFANAPVGGPKTSAPEGDPADRPTVPIPVAKSASPAEPARSGTAPRSPSGVRAQASSPTKPAKAPPRAPQPAQPTKSPASAPPDPAATPPAHFEPDDVASAANPEAPLQAGPLPAGVTVPVPAWVTAVPPSTASAPTTDAMPAWVTAKSAEVPALPAADKPAEKASAALPAWVTTGAKAPRTALTAQHISSGVVSPNPPGLSPASASEWTLAEARASLKQSSESRETLVSGILEYGRRTFDYVGAFAVLRGAASGWDARGEGDVSAIRQLSIPLDAASVFRTVALTRGSYVGPLPTDALTQHYLALLGRAPRTVFLWPIEVKSRLVALVYGDCGSRPVSQRRLSDFILFCQDLPSAFHELILFRKQHRSSASSVAFAPPPPTLEMTVQADSEWLRGLITLLTGPDAAERAMAMAELLKTPAPSAKALAEAFPGPTGWSRLPVVELPEPDELGPIPGAIARLGEAGAVALAPLLHAEDSDTRYLALLTAGSLRYPDVLGGVIDGLFDLEPDISSAARAAAASLKALPQFTLRLPELRQELSSSDSLRKSLTARALGVLHDVESIEGLIALTANDDDLCAQSAAEALKELTRQPHGTNTREWNAWWASARARRRIEWLVDALESDDFDFRLSAIEELSRAFGDNFGYFADGPRPERAGAVARWWATIAARPDVTV